MEEAVSCVKRAIRQRARARSETKKEETGVGHEDARRVVRTQRLRFKTQHIIR